MRLAPIFLILLLFLSLSCGKENQPDIPYVYVYKELYPNSLDYIPIGGYIYVNAGYRGIVVYRLLQDEFRVYERCCPYDPENPNARIIVNSDNSTAIDTCCNSQYSLVLDGTPFGDGPSPYSLVSYYYNYDSYSEKLTIYSN